MRVADVGQYPIGQYAAVVTFGSQVIMTPVTVTTIGILSGSTGGTYAFWAVNLSDFSAHRERVRFTAFANDNRRSARLERRRTRRHGPAGGLGREQHRHRADSRRFGRCHEHVLVQPGARRDGVRANRSSAVSRGQHVHFRAIYRAGEIGSFAPPHGKRRIRVLDDDNTKSSIAP